MDVQSVINWTVVGRLSWLELRRSTAVVYHNDRQALSTTPFRHAGELVTADNFYFYQANSSKALGVFVAANPECVTNWAVYNSHSTFHHSLHISTQRNI